VVCVPRPRLAFTKAAPRIDLERGQHFVDAQSIFRRPRVLNPAGAHDVLFV
jgi:hypothetical protein